MGLPLQGLSPTQLTQFEEGHTTFITPLTIADGVGPIFNEVSCNTCHNQPAAGGFSPRRVTRFGVAAVGSTPFDPLNFLGGTLLQDQSLDLNCREYVPTEATVTAMRGTPILFGAGLLERISDADVQTVLASQSPSVQGVMRTVVPIENPGSTPLGSRFGWKGGVATVHSFSLDASLNEMGITSFFLPNENAPNGDGALLAACDTVNDPEDLPDGTGLTRADRFTHFQRFLAPPAQTPRSGMLGEAIFASVGCAECHTPRYTLPSDPDPVFSGRVVAPYSDFLLHDMGALGDGIVDGIASETQMMTRPLWGMAFRTALLHDGRATGAAFDGLVDMVVAEHGGQASASRAAYQALTAGDRALVVAFLQSLGRAEFDWDLDNELTEFDWYFLEPFLTGPAPAATMGPDHPGAVCDVNQDGAFDLVEFGQLQRVWTGQ
ncbi:MAG: di-heme oxidoredictase family protein [Planctomycetota bacterium]